MPPVVPEPVTAPQSAALAKLLMIGMLLVLLVLVGAAVWRAFSRRRSQVEATLEPVELESELLDELRARTDGRAHHELAAEQSYEQAIHALLLQALTELMQRQSALDAPSTTSREVLARATLSAQEHKALETLVRAVELCLFARREASEAMYRACLEAYTILHASSQRAMVRPEARSEEVA